MSEVPVEIHDRALGNLRRQQRDDLNQEAYHLWTRLKTIGVGYYPKRATIGGHQPPLLLPFGKGITRNATPADIRDLRSAILRAGGRADWPITPWYRRLSRLLTRLWNEARAFLPFVP